MAKLTFAFFLLCFAAGSLVAQVTAGMDETDLFGLKGKPESKAIVGDKKIYRWPDAEVVVRNGKVVSFKPRDLAAERLAAERRAAAVEEARARQAQFPKTTPAAPVVPPAPQSPLERARERSNRANQIADLQSQIKASYDALEQASRRFSNPTNASYSEISPAEQDALRARIVLNEAEIAELERQQLQQ